MPVSDESGYRCEKRQDSRADKRQRRDERQRNEGDQQRVFRQILSPAIADDSREPLQFISPFPATWYGTVPSFAAPCVPDGLQPECHDTRAF